MELSTQIKQARGKLNLTQEDAAKAWGVPLATLRKYEQGQRQPRGLAMTMLRQILASVEDKRLSASSEPPASLDGPGGTSPPKAKKRRRPRPTS